MTTPSYMTECEVTTIDLTNGADQDLWLDVSDRRHNNITAATVEIALGTFAAPGVWHAADQTQPNGAVWKIRAALRIGGLLTYPLGTYWAWTRTTTVGGERVVERAENRLVQIA